MIAQRHRQRSALPGPGRAGISELTARGGTPYSTAGLGYRAAADADGQG